MYVMVNDFGTFGFVEINLDYSKNTFFFIEQFLELLLMCLFLETAAPSTYTLLILCLI